MRFCFRRVQTQSFQINNCVLQATVYLDKGSSLKTVYTVTSNFRILLSYTRIKKFWYFQILTLISVLSILEFISPTVTKRSACAYVSMCCNSFIFGCDVLNTFHFHFLITHFILLYFISIVQQNMFPITVNSIITCFNIYMLR